MPHEIQSHSAGRDGVANQRRRICAPHCNRSRKEAEQAASHCRVLVLDPLGIAIRTGTHRRNLDFGRTKPEESRAQGGRFKDSCGRRQRRFRLGRATSPAALATLVGVEGRI
eukprot:scaffold1661_cov251-Pinguiococcus_pyrenoidosus.AAC.51